MHSEVNIVVYYPLERGQLVLRADSDWDADITAVTVDGHRFEFVVATEKPFLYFKPVIHDGNQMLWSQGDDYLAIATDGRPREIYPYFQPEEHCSACELIEIESRLCEGLHRFRVFHPPGYDENVLKRYPVLYMHDGQTLFFPRRYSRASTGRSPKPCRRSTR